LKSIDFSLDNFKGIINQTKFVVENQKKKYSNLKHKFLELNISYKKDSENLITLKNFFPPPKPFTLQLPSSTIRISKKLTRFFGG